jgi:hypothetical protein
VIDREGNAVSGAQVYVRKQSDSSLVTLYSDNGVTPASNPVTSDNDGEFSFYTADNDLKLEVYIGGVEQQEIQAFQHYDLSVISAAAWTILDDASVGAIRTTLGVGTGDSPQFTAINLGHASDTTIARTGAGDIAIEGNAVYRAGGTDVPVADGGTGASTAADARTNLAVPGTGVTNTFTALQTLSGGASITPAAAPATTAVGYLGSPVNTQDANYTTVMGDSGKTLYHTSGSTHTWTIDSNANVAYPIGTILTFINENGGGNVTIAITADTLRWGGSTGSRTLAANGVASAIKVTSTVWRMTGDGIS